MIKKVYLLELDNLSKNLFLFLQLHLFFFTEKSWTRISFSIHLSAFIFPKTIPETTLMKRPLSTYIRAIFIPNKLTSIIIATSLIIGDDIKKEKAIPAGIPASKKLKNKGIALQEQNGVIIPNKDAKKYPRYFFS